MVVSSNISVSNLVESLNKAFAVNDKWDDCIQEVFAIFTFPIIEFESWFVWFWCRVCLNFQWRTICQVNLATSLFTFLVIICQRHLIVYLAVLNMIATFVVTEMWPVWFKSHCRSWGEGRCCRITQFLLSHTNLEFSIFQNYQWIIIEIDYVCQCPIS